MSTKLLAPDDVCDVEVDGEDLTIDETGHVEATDAQARLLHPQGFITDAAGNLERTPSTADPGYTQLLAPPDTSDLQIAGEDVEIDEGGRCVVLNAHVARLVRNGFVVDKAGAFAWRLVTYNQSRPVYELTAS